MTMANPHQTAPRLQDKVVEQWPGLMMEEYAVLTEKNSDYQRILNDNMEAQNGMLLPGDSSSFFRFLIKNEHACILLSLAGIELGGGDRVLVNISDLERSQQETVLFSLKENHTFISSARLSHIWDKWPRKND
jgi:hypothetical protein